MRRLLLLAALLLFLTPGASAEDEVERILGAVDLEPFEELVREEGAPFDLRKLLRDLATGEAELDLESVKAQATDSLAAERTRLFSCFAALALPALLAAAASCMRFHARGTDAARFVCRLAVASTGGGVLLELCASARQLVERAAAVGEAVAPPLLTLLNATGAQGTVLLLTPMSAFFTDVCLGLFRDLGIRLALAAAAVAIAGGLHARLKLRKLFLLICDILNWGAGLVMTAFVGLLSVQGALGRGYDSASVRAAQYTVDNLLPVIGGEVADTVGAMISSALLVKNALGVAGMLLVLWTCAAPLLRMAAALLSLRLAAAVMEPLGADGLAALTGDLAKTAQTLLVIAAASAVLVLLLLGAALAAGQGLVR